MSIRQHPPSNRRVHAAATTILLLAVAGGGAARQPPLPSHTDGLVSRDPSGWVQTSTPTGHIDKSNPFFQSLGSNGRSCSTCHRQAEGWTISAAEVRQRFAATRGTDPIFRLVDGAD